MKVRRLAAQHEVRFETARKSPAEEAPVTPPSGSGSGGAGAGAAAVKRTDVLRVVSGSAEVGGRELFAGHEYPLLPDRSYGVFTWFGCEVELDEGGFCRDVYTSEETQMTTLVKLHDNLEALRARGEAPRIAVVGPANCGKSTLAQTLAAYAVRSGRKPVLVDLDLAKNSLGVPGCVGATVLHDPADAFSESGDLGLSARRPLLFFAGVTSPADNSARVKDQIDLLAQSVAARESAAGLIIDTFAWSSNASTQGALVAALKSLKASVVLVVGHDRLLSAMKDAFQGDPAVHAVVKIPRSGGVPETDASAAKRRASEAARWYFEGPRWGLSPESVTLKLGQDVDILLTKQVTVADESLRPIGMAAAKEDSGKLPRMKALDRNLEHCLLAVSAAKEEQDVLTSSVAGFVHVVQVDLATDSIVVLSPCSGPLPSRFLLHGKVKHFEAT